MADELDMRKPSSLLLDSRLSLVHFERFSMQVVTVEFLFGRVSRLSRIHFNETKSLWNGWMQAERFAGTSIFAGPSLEEEPAPENFRMTSNRYLLFGR